MEGTTLFSSIVSDSEGLLILRKDEKYYYLEALPERTPEDLAREAQREAEDAAKGDPILELPAEEAEVVAPRVSKTRIRLAEISEGFPRRGYGGTTSPSPTWTATPAEIVSPPPRLSGRGSRLQVPRRQVTTVNVQLENPQNLRIGYGGVAISDLDGDGSPTCCGAGTAPAWRWPHLGDFRFRAESRTSRARCRRARWRSAIWTATAEERHPRIPTARVPSYEAKRSSVPTGTCRAMTSAPS